MGSEEDRSGGRGQVQLMYTLFSGAVSGSKVVVKEGGVLRSVLVPFFIRIGVHGYGNTF